MSDYKKNHKLEIGMEVHNNSVAPWTDGAIPLCPTGNSQSENY